MRSGFPETNGQAEMAVDKFDQNGEGKEKKEKEDIMILDEENKQNSAAALRWVYWEFCEFFVLVIKFII